MKLSRATGPSTSAELPGKPGSEVQIPLTLFRAPEFKSAARIELASVNLPASLITAAPLDMPREKSGGVFILQIANDPRVVGERTLVLRAFAQKDGKWPVVSELTVALSVSAAPAP